MRPTVMLFDIDGTLVTTGSVGRRALDRVFEVRHGRPDACRQIRFDGMTDKAIVRQGLQAIDRPADDAEIDATLAEYVALLERLVAEADDLSYHLHAGMREAVETALGLPGFAVGLGTGNIREGARVKLSRVGIYDRFAFGGFGCDFEDRTALIRRGAERGAERLGVALAQCRVVVIGDTPKDVAAALGIGAQCLGVGTGSFSPEELTQCGAAQAYADLAVPGALEWLLGRD